MKRKLRISCEGILAAGQDMRFLRTLCGQALQYRERIREKPAAQADTAGNQKNKRIMKKSVDSHSLKG